MSNHIADKAIPLTVRVTIDVSAIVYPEPDVGGFSAEVPGLPGCYTQGETLDEIRSNLQEAAEGWLASCHDEAVARQRNEGPRT
jgi:predicted RNase H-like HicB family nuclease